MVFLLLFCLFPFILKANCGLSFLSQLRFFVKTVLSCSPSPLFLLQFTAVPWQESIPFVIPTYLPWSYPYFSWVLFEVYFFSTYLVFFDCLSLHFIFKFGSLPPELIACVLEIGGLLTYKVLIPYSVKKNIMQIRTHNAWICCLYHKSNSFPYDKENK